MKKIKVSGCINCPYCKSNNSRYNCTHPSFKNDIEIPSEYLSKPLEMCPAMCPHWCPLDDEYIIPTPYICPVS